jgi:hypothetical protein
MLANTQDKADRLDGANGDRGSESTPHSKPNCNVERTMTAPVTVIVAYDMKFYEQVPKLFPQSPGLTQLFESNPQLVEVTALIQNENAK